MIQKIQFCLLQIENQLLVVHNETLMVVERLNPAHKCALCCSNLIYNTREKHDVPESKQDFTLMSPLITQ